MATVLIADDEPNIVVSLEFMMKREGYEVLVARDGQVFRDVLRRQSISMAEFEAGMRAAGCAAVDEIRVAVLEPNGHISVIRRDTA